MSRIAVVTGGTGGIGLETARALARRGYRVYALSRKPASDPAYTHIVCNVADETACRDAVARIMQQEGHIDLLINNAGFGISGAVEFTASADSRRLMDVNLFGADNMTRAVLPHMREAGGGRIVNISSVAAPLPIPFQTWYSVSKAAVLAYTQALVNEVKPFGITACAILPGDTKTGFTAARESSNAGNEIYAGRMKRSVARMERDETNGASPEKAGAAIARIADKKRVKPQYAIGIAYKIIVVLSRLLPVRFVTWVLGKLYGEWGNEV